MSHHATVFSGERPEERIRRAEDLLGFCDAMLRIIDETGDYCRDRATLLLARWSALALLRQAEGWGQSV